MLKTPVQGTHYLTLNVVGWAASVLVFEICIGRLLIPHLNDFGLQGTVEERMEAVQARKQRMISGALTDQEVRTARIEELKMLFT